MGNFNVVVTQTAVIDCTIPQIANVQVTDVGPFQATITFDTNEECTGTVRYGSLCGSLALNITKTGLNTSHAIVITGLSSNQTFFFAVDAEDEAGNLATNDNGGTCFSLTTPDIPIYFTEQFQSTPDLDFTSLEFTPNGSSDFYRGCAMAITGVPTDPVGGTAITLTDDDSELISLTGGATISLYGVSYTEFYIGSNGYLTFGQSHTDYSETLAEHFEIPRVAALYDDLNPANGGTISWKQTVDRVAVTFDEVQEITTGNLNTFQFELFFDGKITINYEDIGVGDCITGLSQGQDLPQVFYSTDLSELGSCVDLCPEDLFETGVVDIDDLRVGVGSWRLSGVPADLDSSGIVDIIDLLAVMAAFGDCPVQ